MSIKWKTTKTELPNEASRCICVGRCLVSRRSHFSSKEGFRATHIGISSTSGHWRKGHCAGKPLKTGAPKAEVIETEGHYQAAPVWLKVKNATDEALCKAYAQADWRAEQLASFTKVRAMLSKRAPKKVIEKFDRAIKHGDSHTRKRLCNQYGIRI